MGNDKRIVWVDNLKGLLLLLTCTSHFIPKPWIIAVILKPTPTYYVPLFIFLSGYLCKPLPPDLTIWGGQKNLVKKRFRILIIPYFFFSALGLISGYFTGEDINTMIWEVFYFGTSCHAARPIWFVACLFMISISFTWITWLNKLPKLHTLITIVFGLLAIWLFTKDTQIRSPWYIKSLPWHGSFFLLGFIIKTIESEYLENWKQRKDKIIIWTFLILLIFVGVWGLINPIKGTLLAIVCPVSLMTGFIGCTHLSQSVFALASKPVQFLQFVAINGVAILGTHNFVSGLFHFVEVHSGIMIHPWVSFIFIFTLVWLFLYYIAIPYMNRFLYKLIGKSVPV